MGEREEQLKFLEELRAVDSRHFVCRTESILNSPNRFGYCLSKSYEPIFKEFEGLSSRKRKFRNEFSWDQPTNAAIDIAEALKDPHEKQIDFGSLCAFNVFVDEEFNKKLFDFDSHQNLQNKNKNDTIDIKISKRDRRYDSPELIYAFGGDPSVNEYAFASDVYSYRFLLLELIAKKVGDDETDIIELVEMKFRYSCSPIERNLRNLAMKCVQHEYERRPNINEAVTLLKDLVKELPTRKRRCRSNSSEGI